MSPFVHLHVHSHYSPMRGVSSVEALCEATRAQGADTLALTDTNGLYGAIRFLKIARQHGLRPILGAELTDVGHNTRPLQASSHPLFHPPHPQARQDAPSARGPSLPRQALSSFSPTHPRRHFTRPAPNRPRPVLFPGTRPFPVDAPLADCTHPPQARRDAPLPERRAVLLAKTTEGYANLCRLLSARHCDASFDFIQAVNQYRNGLIILSDDEEALTSWGKESPYDLYVELTPGPMMHQSLTFSRCSGLPPVATNRVHFVHREEFAVHRLLRAIALNATLSRLPQDAGCSSTHWLMPPSLLERHYPHVPEALENTRRIAEACRTDWDFQGTIFPAFREFSDRHAFALLRKKTYRGAKRRYGNLSQDVMRRIEDELAIIWKKKFAKYFLVVNEIVRQAPRTCGRGSVAASIVSYCLGITHVDPLKHHLFFERFLNPGREDPPDIDIDFPWDERDKILEWVFQKYGGQKAARVANQNTMELRGALREVAKVYGMPHDKINHVSSQILRQKDFLRFEETPTPQAWAAGISQALHLNEPWPEIISAAVQVHGHFRHLSVHCGGVVIVPDEIRRYVPVENAAKGVPVIQWEKDQAEEAGLVKIDLLGNRSLAVIRDALAAIKENTGRCLDYVTWDPLNDPATQELIRRGDSIGCFYIESPATRLLLKKLWGGMPQDRRARADVFEYLVMVSSLVRPATNPFIQEFIRRAHGETHPPLHPIVEDVLEETHGIMTYQEDVTRIAMALAGFSVTDADQLRKVLSKKHKERQLRDYCAQFYKGAADNGASPRVIDILWAMIMSFAGYSFCKPHSASYAQVSFKCAYLRAHYPAEFMAAVISNQGGFYSTFAYVSEARRMGLTILPPDVNASNWAYVGRENTLRIGLMQVKTLTQSLAERIAKERSDNGPFRSFHDFLTRVRPEQAQARALIRAGCCDSVAGELTRPALLWRLYAGPQGKQVRTNQELDLPELSGPVGPLPIPDDYSERQKVAHEVETLGLVWSRHPLELYQAHLHGVRHIDACDMARYVGRQVTMIGWLITEKSVETKDGEPMEFVTFEDTTALYDATVFPDAYRRFCHLLVPDRPYILCGLIEENFGTVTLTVHDLEYLSDERHRRYLVSS